MPVKLMSRRAALLAAALGLYPVPAQAGWQETHITLRLRAFAPSAFTAPYRNDYDASCSISSGMLSAEPR